MTVRVVRAWTDSLRCHRETPGIGIAESDEPFVLVASIDLARKDGVGASVTDVVLYGPLQNVDAKENHSFPRVDFWHGRLDPSAVVFLVALLEHDNVNPHVTRQAVAVAIRGVAAAWAGSPRDKIVREALSALSAAAEPFTGPGASRLVGPPTELRFTAPDLDLARTGGTARQVLRFSSYGDYSVHFLLDLDPAAPDPDAERRKNPPIKAVGRPKKPPTPEELTERAVREPVRAKDLTSRSIQDRASRVTHVPGKLTDPR